MNRKKEMKKEASSAILEHMIYNVAVYVGLYWIVRHAGAWNHVPNWTARRHPTTAAKKTTKMSERPQTARSNYKETIADDQMRLFWENQTFDATERILDAVIYRNASFGALLVRDDDDQAFDRSRLFSPLFEELSTQYVCNDTLPTCSNRQRSHRSNFRLVLAYRGSDFCGFQSQHDNKVPSVQQTLEEWLAKLSTDNNITTTSNDKVNILVSGRTDAGVHAVGQVCRFRTKQNVTAKQVLHHLEACLLVQQGSLKCLQVSRETDSFHPTFGCTKRAYAYLIDPINISATQVERLNSMLQRIEGQEFDYVAMSYGRVKTETTLCTLEYCRASIVTFSVTGERLLCIEFVGNRFLRRMVRILVATSLRQVMNDDADGGENDEESLLRLIQSRDRKLAARPAPPFGLLFVGAKVSESEQR